MSLDTKLREKERIGEMERQVENLREKLSRLENMLPNDVARELSNETENLSRQLLDVEQDCAKGRRLTAGGKNSFMVREKLTLLESFSQKLSDNLESLEKSHEDFTQEAQHLSQVLEQTQSMERGDCAPLSRVRDECCECDLPNKGNCACCEVDAITTTDSDDSCSACNLGFLKRSKGRRRCECGQDSDISICGSEDEKNGNFDEKSTCTCWCSKNESHIELLESDSVGVCDTDGLLDIAAVERMRAGLDLLHNKGSSIASTVNSSQNGIVQNPIKVSDLRESLERLKIRNRSLKDFLSTLQSPLTLLKKPSEALSSVLTTKTSSCYSIDLPNKTRNSLLTVVKTLEGKCRNKDAIIVALADELNTENTRKPRHPGKEISPIGSKVWKISDQKKKFGRRFARQGSAIGFLIIIMVLISQFVKSEIMSYLSSTRKLFTESPLKPLLSEGQRLSDGLMVLNMKYVFKPILNLFEFMWYQWKNIYEALASLSDMCTSQIIFLLSLVVHLITENMYYAVGTAIMFLNVIAFVKARNVICYKLSSLKPCIGFFKSDKFLSILKTILSARIFWFVIGYYCNVLWNYTGAEFVEFVSSNYFYFQESFQTSNEDEEIFKDTLEDDDEKLGKLVNFETELAEVREYSLLENFDYVWLITVLATGIKDIVDISYNLLINILT